MNNNIIDYFEHDLISFPEKIFLSDKELSLKYCEAERIIKQIAANIESCCPGLRRSPVPVIVGRSAYSILAILGVVYSGNYYVPIEHDMPKPRFDLIMSSLTPALIIDSVSSQLETELPVINLDSGYSFDEKQFCLPEIESSDPIYAIFTSGSTGTPKGVLKSHRAVASFVEAYCETFSFAHDEVIGNQTPFSFDASAKDIYLAIKLGASIDIIPTELFSFPIKLVEHLNSKKISFISWVPSALSMISQMNVFNEIRPEYLKKVFFVGEVFPMNQLKVWVDALPRVEFVNLYGASELAGICCYYVVPHDLEGVRQLPMGKTLSNCSILLVNDDNTIIEPSSVGEIYLSSPALFDGYIGNGVPSADSVFAELNGIRYFKTGDLASFNEHGDLVFASRKDFQIKHMGYRIELQDIEATVNSINSIQSCCCVYHQEKNKIICFYQAPENINKELVRKVREKLPRYMCPNKFVWLEKMPLNNNGKIDRQYLRSSLNS